MIPAICPTRDELRGRYRQRAAPSVTSDLVGETVRRRPRQSSIVLANKLDRPLQRRYRQRCSHVARSRNTREKWNWLRPAMLASVETRSAHRCARRRSPESLEDILAQRALARLAHLTCDGDQPSTKLLVTRSRTATPPGNRPRFPPPEFTSRSASSWPHKRSIN